MLDADFDLLMIEMKNNPVPPSDMPAYLFHKQVSPTQAIKAYRQHAKVSLGEAKITIMDSPIWFDDLRSTRQLHAEIEKVLDDIFK